MYMPRGIGAAAAATTSSLTPLEVAYNLMVGKAQFSLVPTDLVVKQGALHTGQHIQQRRATGQ